MICRLQGLPAGLLAPCRLARGPIPGSIGCDELRGHRFPATEAEVPMLNEVRAGAVLAVTAATLLSLAAPARALEEPAEEWDRMKACEKSLCTMIINMETNDK